MSRPGDGPTLRYLPLAPGPACALAPRRGVRGAYARIALLHWPRLDRAALARAGGRSAADRPPRGAAHTPPARGHPGDADAPPTP